MDAAIDLNILESEPAEAYHAQSDRFLSSHQLLDFIKCPWLHHKKSLGLIEDSDSPSYLIGRAAHTRILEGPDALEAAFALGDPSTRRPASPSARAPRLLPSGPPSRASRSCRTTSSIWSSRWPPGSR